MKNARGPDWAGESAGVGGRLVLWGERSAERWILISSIRAADFLVNGRRLAGAGMSALRDQDEIRAVGTANRVFFSTESKATPEAYEPTDAGGASNKVAIRCPRCRQEIAEGKIIIRCPQCGAIHHETEELPCFSYEPTCACCDYPTDLEGYRWSPEEL